MLPSAGRAAPVLTGFTLVELLIAIAIVGLLATIAIVSLNTTRIRARDAKRVSDLRQIQLALELFSDSHNQTYPAADLYALGACSGGVACGLAAPDACGTKPCMNPLPADPTGGGVKYWYTYANATAPTSFHLGANLEEANSSLNSDRDCEDDTGGQAPSCGSAAYTVGSTPVGGVGIANAADDGDGCQDVVNTNRYCYDVTN